ncbi:hypothetical protein AB0J51_04025 [Micromonospora echinofusca]|uniref:hypothetical protein n=1 Tax=Micromonospora echinofusca TaxID=47858 RepID=UPI003427627D
MSDDLEGLDEWDAELQQIRARANAPVPDSLAAREFDEEDAKHLTWATAEMEYAARLAAGVWAGRSDARSGQGWQWAGYVEEKASNAERAARDVVNTIRKAKGWMPNDEQPVLDGTGFAEGDQPAIRRARADRDYLAFPCYFCGDRQMKRSYSDSARDPGRLELYCDSPNCDAREVVVLIRRGAGAHLREDVRAINDVRPPAQRLSSGDTWLSGMLDGGEPTGLASDK